jgi:hypothetical protein
MPKEKKVEEKRTRRSGRLQKVTAYVSEHPSGEPSAKKVNAILASAIVNSARNGVVNINTKATMGKDTVGHNINVEYQPIFDRFIVWESNERPPDVLQGKYFYGQYTRWARALEIGALANGRPIFWAEEAEVDDHKLLVQDAIKECTLDVDKGYCSEYAISLQKLLAKKIFYM